MTSALKTTAMVAITGLALAGCKTQIATSVSLNELDDPEVTAVPGVVRLEVASCANHEDSRQPSDSLVKAQEMMPRIFPLAEFEECYRQEFDSWAEFSMPLVIDRDDDGEPVSTDTINLLTTETAPLVLLVPDALTQRIEEAKRSNSMLGSLDMAMRIDVINDTEESLLVNAYGVWVDDQPVVLGQVDLKPDAQTTFVLSDVTIALARQQQYATVLTYP